MKIKNISSQLTRSIRRATTSSLLLTSPLILAAPGTPAIGHMTTDFALVEVNQAAIAYEQLVTLHDAVEIPITWNRWSGEEADLVNYKLNNVTIKSSSLTASNSNTATEVLTISEGGRYTLSVELCNANGCSESEAKTIVVADTDGSHVEPISLNVSENNRAYTNTTDSVIATYFVEWSVYGRKYPVDRIPANNLTHIIYGFIPICGGDGINDGLKTIGGNSFNALQSACSGREDFKVAIHDPWAALQKPQAGHDFNTPYKGNFGQFMELKKAYPHLKIVPSIGGWTLSDPFFHFGNTVYRDRFVESVGEFLQTWKFFDGIDIDWEFPGGFGATPGLGNAASDGRTYVLLMQELREKLDELEEETGREYELTSAIGNSPEKLAVVDFGEAQQYMDYLFPLTYDFYGAWSNTLLGHHTALFASDFRPGEEAQTDSLVKTLLEQGVEPGKIAVGAAMYGRGWTGVSDTGNHLMTGTANGPVKGTWENGVLDYRAIAELKQSGEWEYHYDETAEAPYLYKRSSGDLVTYDDERSVRAKAKYVQENQLAGFFSWEIDGDNGDILNAMHEGLGHPSASPGSNRSPLANAGVDQSTTEGGVVQLDGSSSYDPDGDALTFEWTQVSGLAVTLSNSDNESASFSTSQTNATNVFEFELTVSDGEFTATDTVRVTTQPASQDNTPPTVDAISPITLKSGESTNITANAQDADGDTLTFDWAHTDSLLTTVNSNASVVTLTANDVTSDTNTTLNLTVSDGTDSRTISVAITILADNDDSENNNSGNNNTCQTTDSDANNHEGYDSSRVYNGGDKTSHNNLVWEAKWWTKGVEPSLSASAWKLASDLELPWSADKAYVGGEEINYDGRRYRAKWWTKGANPAASDVWVDIDVATCE
ncbi:Chitinase A [BD1-7 clade bacterium]|uniref:chitinase n=1 Tax=BD1-7 clade bacterium TaxID=2029982 RepID=A0A5S9QY66_9GAMM|nr:Chitinase A [BD1-7 clade bacterium]